MTGDYFEWLFGLACAALLSVSALSNVGRPVHGTYCTTTNHVDARGRPCEFPRRADRSR